MPEFYMIYARKNNKMPKLYMIFCPKNIFFQFFGGGGNFPPAAISYAYDDDYSEDHDNQDDTLNEGEIR